MISQEELHSRLIRAGEATQIEFSKQAEDLIYNTLVALQEDPSARWDATSAQMERVTDAYVQDIDILVFALAGDERAFTYFEGPYFPRWQRYARLRRRRGRITYFDVLHFIADNMNWLNPFPKDRTTPTNG